nr:MAG TPA: hypothetical protein [Caudoviricetes sp.]
MMDGGVLDVLGNLFRLRSGFEKRAGKESVGSRRQTIGGHIDPLRMILVPVEVPVFNRIALITHVRSPILGHQIQEFFLINPVEADLGGAGVADNGDAPFPPTVLADHPEGVFVTVRFAFGEPWTVTVGFEGAKHQLLDLGGDTAVGQVTEDRIELFQQGGGCGLFHGEGSLFVGSDTTIRLSFGAVKTVYRLAGIPSHQKKRGGLTMNPPLKPPIASSLYACVTNLTNLARLYEDIACCRRVSTDGAVETPSHYYGLKHINQS